jgi:hypothetical protein
MTSHGEYKEDCLCRSSYLPTHRAEKHFHCVRHVVYLGRSKPNYHFYSSPDAYMGVFHFELPEYVAGVGRYYSESSNEEKPWNHSNSGEH